MIKIILFDKPENSKLHLQRLNNINSSLHIHIESEIEIMIILQGSAECSIDGTTYKLEKENIVIIFPNQPHFYYNSLNIDAVLLVFNSNIFEELNYIFDNYIPAESVIGSADFKKINIKLIIESLLYDISSDNNILKKGYAMVIVSKLFNILELQKAPKEDKTDFLAQAKDYCYNNFTKEISLSDVAKYVNVSPNYLSNIFKRKFGINFNRYINILKVNYACKQLSSNKLSISEIALKCGFKSIRTFNRVFQKELNITPLQYRNTRSKSKCGENFTLDNSDIAKTKNSQ